MKRYIPPFTITPKILQLLQAIAKEIGTLKGRKLVDIPLSLRRHNNIRTIQSSLAIEGNTLSVSQITDLLEGKKVLGPAQDIAEVKNALNVYEQLIDFDPLNQDHLLEAHRLLMVGLIEENGQWRTAGVGILKGDGISHIAPPAKRVAILIDDLFDYIKTADLSWLLKACIFHYELEFIHPFQDGNGRMGRLWQQLLLMKEDPIFRYVCVEVLVKEHQQEYYRVLSSSDKAGESTAFIEFSLETIFKAMIEFSSTALKTSHDSTSRLLFAKAHFQKSWFSRKEYINVQGDISSATASRDLLFGIKSEILISKGKKNQTYYQFIG